MAAKILTSELKPGMIVTSQRTVKGVYSLGTNFDQCRRFPMKGKAIVLKELTKVRLARKKTRWNRVTNKNDEYESYITRNMLLLSHYKHGIVMYFAHRMDDFVWRLIPEKEAKTE